MDYIECAIIINNKMNQMDELIMENRNQLKDTFNEIINGIVNETNDNEMFMKILNDKMKNTLNERKQNITIMAESMIDDSKILIDQWINEIRS